jgi:hypothetical protein
VDVARGCHDPGMLRSRRLEKVLGAPIAELTSEHMRRLVEERVQETFDLDFKRDLYGYSDSAKRELAADVAAMANSGGGLIILGIDEDEHACAQAASGVLADDADVTRILQIVGSLVAPVPDIDVRVVMDAESADKTSYLLVAVDRSPAAPHAVAVDKGLRYPRRNGTTKRYLTEGEVADAYRSRLAGSAQVEKRLARVWEDGIARFDELEQGWVAVALVPDVPGAMTLDKAAFEAFRDHWVYQSTDPSVLQPGITAQRAQVGQGRLTALGGNRGRTEWLCIDNYTDGAGFFARLAGRLGPAPSGAPAPIRFDDEAIADGILSGLVTLAAHADAARASGTALLMAGVYGLGRGGAFLCHSRGSFNLGGTYNEDDPLRSLPEPARGALPLDALIGGGRPVISLASGLCASIVQGFGVPDTHQFSAGGLARRLYFVAGRQDAFTARVESHGFEWTDETV